MFTITIISNDFLSTIQTMSLFLCTLRGIFRKEKKALMHSLLPVSQDLL